MKKESLKKLSRNFIECHSEKNFAKLYDRMFSGLLKYSYRITGSFEDAQDAVSITFSKAYGSIDKFIDPTKGELSSWIYRICKSESFRIVSARKYQEHVISIPEDAEETEVLSSYVDTKTINDGEKWNEKEFCSDLQQRNNNRSITATSSSRVHGIGDFMRKDVMYDNFLKISLEEMKNLSNKKTMICMKEKYLNGMFIKDIENKYKFHNVNAIIMNGKKELRRNILKKYPDMCNIFFNVFEGETMKEPKKFATYKLHRKIFVYRKFDINAL